eukprot:SAG31_NODE_65_length_28565_cov_8.402914_2_plen_85_part_00
MWPRKKSRNIIIAKEQRRRRQEKREEIQRERQKIATIQKDVNELTTTVTSKALITPAGHYDQLESLDIHDGCEGGGDQMLFNNV